jgi:hypothetical protein
MYNEGPANVLNIVCSTHWQDISTLARHPAILLNIMCADRPAADSWLKLG